MKKIYIVCGNPVASSFSCAVAESYKESAIKCGAEVRMDNILNMEFDPVLHYGYEKIQELEPDLITFQENIKWADHFVVIYPNWWTSMPAKLKGLFDRAFLPGFAFNFVDGKFVPRLTGKTSRVINICGSISPFVLFMFIGPFTNTLSRGILKSCGFRVKVNRFGKTKDAGDKKRKGWLEEVKKLAQKDCN